MRALLTVGLFFAALAFNAPSAHGLTLVGGLLSANGGSLVTATTNGERGHVAVDSYISCGSAFFPLHLHARADVDAGGLTAKGRGALKLGKGHLKYHWRLKLRYTPAGARGVLAFGGRRPGSRCKSDRLPVILRENDLRQPEGDVGPPPRSSAFYGRNEFGAVLVQVDAKRRMHAAWTGDPGCAGDDDYLTNFTPLTAIRGARFEREERFVIPFAEGVRFHYRVRFGGLFLEAGAAGSWRIRLRITGPGGRLLERCDSGPEDWAADLAE